MQEQGEPVGPRPHHGEGCLWLGVAALEDGDEGVCQLVAARC